MIFAVHFMIFAGFSENLRSGKEISTLNVKKFLNLHNNFSVKH